MAPWYEFWGMILAAICVITVGAWISALWSKTIGRRNLDKIPGVQPFVPAFIQMLTNMLNQDRRSKNIRKHKDLGFCAIYNTTTQHPDIVVFDADLLPLVATGKDSYRKHAIHKEEEKMFGAAVTPHPFIFTADGNTEEWKLMRSTLGPAFRLHSLERVCDQIYERATALTKKWTNKAQSSEGFANVKALPEMQALTMDVIFTALVSKCLHVVEQDKYELLAAYNTFQRNLLLRVVLGRLMDWKTFSHLILPEHTYHSHRVKSIFTQLVDKRFKEREEAGVSEQNDEETPAKDVLDYLIKKHRFTKDQITDELMGTIFPGHETTATVTTYCLYYIASNPEWKEKLYEEVTREWADVKMGSVTIADVNRLTELNRFILEVLRLHPPTNFMRVLAKDVQYKGYTIPKETTLIIDTREMMRNEKHWKNPDTFNPNRFDPDEKPPMHAFVPFATGNHSCLVLYNFNNKNNATMSLS